MSSTSSLADEIEISGLKIALSARDKTIEILMQVVKTQNQALLNKVYEKLTKADICIGCYNDEENCECDSDNEMEGDICGECGNAPSGCECESDDEEGYERVCDGCGNGESSCQCMPDEDSDEEEEDPLYKSPDPTQHEAIKAHNKRMRQNVTVVELDEEPPKKRQAIEVLDD